MERQSLHLPNNQGTIDYQSFTASADHDPSLALAVNFITGKRPANPVSWQQIMLKLRELQLVSKDGCPKGFVTVLPRAKFAEAAINSHDAKVFKEFAAHTIEFPLVYDHDTPGLSDLTSHFEKENRVFSFPDSRRNLRMAYAADAAMFAFLRGKKIRNEAASFFLYSNTPVFRKWHTGELSGMDRTYQYTIPDLHLFTPPARAAADHSRIVQLNSQRSEHWFGHDWFFLIEVNRQFYQDHPDVVTQLIASCPVATVLKITDAETKYYVLKTACMVAFGPTVQLMYHTQWDQMNCRRFLIAYENGEAPTIIHSNHSLVAHRLLPALVSLGLEERRPKVIPAGISPVHLHIISVNGCSRELLERIMNEAERHDLRIRVTQAEALNIGRALKTLKGNWEEFYCIIGGKEKSIDDVVVQHARSQERSSYTDFVTRMSNETKLYAPDMAAYHNFPFLDGGRS